MGIAPKVSLTQRGSELWIVLNFVNEEITWF